MTFHCQSVLVAIARKHWSLGRCRKWRLLQGSIPSTICGGRNVTNECWVKTKFYKLFTIIMIFTKCWVNVGVFFFQNVTNYFWYIPRAPERTRSTGTGTSTWFSSMMAFESGTGLDMFWKTVENTYIGIYLFCIKLSRCWSEIFGDMFNIINRVVWTWIHSTKCFSNSGLWFCAQFFQTGLFEVVSRTWRTVSFNNYGHCGVKSLHICVFFLAFVCADVLQCCGIWWGGGRAAQKCCQLQISSVSGGCLLSIWSGCYLFFTMYNSPPHILYRLQMFHGVSICPTQPFGTSLSATGGAFEQRRVSDEFCMRNCEQHKMNLFGTISFYKRFVSNICPPFVFTCPWWKTNTTNTTHASTCWWENWFGWFPASPPLRDPWGVLSRSEKHHPSD